MKTGDPVIGVVGPCAAGKSTLVAELRSRGFQVRHIAQEHSYVQDMWKVISNPDILIYLDVSFQVSAARTDSSWTVAIYEKQIQRLEHAKRHADIYIQTDDLTPEQVLDHVLEYLEE